eukprot:10565066-Alexandrium_andersonii.AAC.1
MAEQSEAWSWARGDCIEQLKKASQGFRILESNSCSSTATQQQSHTTIHPHNNKLARNGLQGLAWAGMG